jgi:hypothetical protein
LLLFFSLPLFINETTAEGILGTEFFIWHRETFDLWDAAAQPTLVSLPVRYIYLRRVPSAPPPATRLLKQTPSGHDACGEWSQVRCACLPALFLRSTPPSRSY